jgi:hypothetical protein
MHNIARGRTAGFLGPPVVLEDLDEIGTLPDVVGHSRAIARDGMVVQKDDRDQKDAQRHGIGLVDQADGAAAVVAFPFQVAWRRDEDPVHVEAMNHHDGSLRLAEAAALRPLSEATPLA